MFYMFKNAYYIDYTKKHRKAFRGTQLRLEGKVTLRAWLHDLDKLIMYYFIPKDLASKIHKKISRHHDRAKTKRDYQMKVIDFESCRFTKPDKPYPAREWIYKTMDQKLIETIYEPILKEYNL